MKNLILAIAVLFFIACCKKKDNPPPVDPNYQAWVIIEPNTELTQVIIGNDTINNINYSDIGNDPHLTPSGPAVVWIDTVTFTTGTRYNIEATSKKSTNSTPASVSISIQNLKTNQTKDTTGVHDGSSLYFKLSTSFISN